MPHCEICKQPDCHENIGWPCKKCTKDNGGVWKGMIVDGDPSSNRYILRPYREIIHMATAVMWSLRSTCKRAQCGAVITTHDMKQVLSVGYNGPGAGLPDDRCRGTEGQCGCLHAETNAILRANPGVNRVLFTTSAPCEQCAQHILGTEISRVIYLRMYRDSMGLNLLEGKVKIEKIDPNEIASFLSQSEKSLPLTLKQLD